MISSHPFKLLSGGGMVSRGGEASWRVSGGVPNGVPKGSNLGSLVYPPSEVDPRGLALPFPNTKYPFYARLNGGIWMSRVQVTSRPPIWGPEMINLGGRNP